MIHILPISAARKDLSTLVDKAKNKFDKYYVTVNGTPAAVIMSAAEFDGWQETNEILSDPQLMADIKQGEKDIAEGRVYSLEQVLKELDA